MVGLKKWQQKPDISYPAADVPSCLVEPQKQRLYEEVAQSLGFAPTELTRNQHLEFFEKEGIELYNYVQMSAWFTEKRKQAKANHWCWRFLREKLIKVMIAEIERSVPLTPIQLTPEGDLLREYPSGMVAFGSANHTRDDSNLSSCVGVHEFCNGWMDRKRVTKTHDAIVCRRCCLRVLFPKEAKTYGDLRQAIVFQRV